jgi:hypothetical protein
MTYVSLEISNSGIKILSLKGKRVKKWGRIDLKAGLVRDGLITDPPSVAAAISELFKSTGIRKEGITVSLAGLTFTYRVLGLPRMKPALLEEAIMRAARKEMSLPLEELYLAWQTVPGKTEEQSFFVLGVRRNLVDAVARTFGLAGIEAGTMELQPLALARAANRRDAIAVSLDPDCFNIVFIAEGVPVVIHTISPRGEGATLEDNIRRLADELTKTAAFYQSGHPENRLTPETPLLLAGDLAGEAPAAGLLQGEVEYPVEPLDPPVEFPPGIPAASYAVGAGLALNYISRKAAGRTREGFYDINLNILSGKYRKSRAKPVPAFQIWLSLLVVTAAVLLLPLHQYLNKLGTDNTYLENQLRRVNLDLNLAALTSEDAAAAAANITATINSTLILKTADQSLLSARGSFIRDLHSVTAARPPGLLLTSIAIGGSRITLRGETDSVFTAVGYATALEAVPFREVRISRLDEAPLPANSADGAETAPGTASVIIFDIQINK